MRLFVEFKKGFYEESMRLFVKFIHLNGRYPPAGDPPPIMESPTITARDTMKRIMAAAR